jgi:hypothetical protein
MANTFSDHLKTTALGNTALKTGEKCSFRTPKVERDPGRFPPVFALSCLRSLRFLTV